MIAADRHGSTGEETEAFDASGLHDAHPRLQLITGSRPDLTSETLELLRLRLRTAALLLCAGFAAFLIKSLLLEPDKLLQRPWLLGTHVLATLVTGLVGVRRLCTNCPILLRHLRLAEGLVFGVSALFFSALSYELILAGAAAGYLPAIIAPWFFLLFTYALFMPNTWQRSLLVICPIAVLPVAVMGITYAVAPEVREIPNFREGVLEAAMSMTLGATMAVWGVYTIRTLRREAFEAKQLGQYQLKRLIGSGGMGQVYIAEHTLLKRPCAIKLIRPEAAGDPRALARFEREVQATAKLTHWNTVEIYDYGRTDDGTFYYVMEYLPGMTLADLVERYGPLEPGRVVYLLSQVCEALGEAHSRGMVHRDLKPANIFAAKRGRSYDVAKLLDFGLVRELTQPVDAALTAQHTITGSPLFMSPEQATGQPVDHRSDIYSLGAVAYTLLTGTSLFSSDNPIQLILAHAHQTPTWPSAADVPRDLADVVMRCLEKDPLRRFQSTDELRDALGACACAPEWSALDASAWWQCNECPQKKQLDDAVLEGDLNLVKSA